MTNWDVEAAVSKLEERAKDHSLGRCAEFVRVAVESGGLTLRRHNSAKDYGESLAAVGFMELSVGTLLFKKGDIAVVQPIPGHPHGHIAMFNGKIWISDFRQNHGYYPGPGYRKIKPPVALYRFGTADDRSAILPHVYAFETALA